MEKGYFNITAVGTTTLINRNEDRGSLNYVKMTNTSSAGMTVELYLEDDTTERNVSYLLKTVIPSGVTMMVDEGISFNGSIFDLKLTVSNARAISESTYLSVIIK